MLEVIAKTVAKIVKSGTHAECMREAKRLGMTVTRYEKRELRFGKVVCTEGSASDHTIVYFGQSGLIVKGAEGISNLIQNRVRQSDTEYDFSAYRPEQLLRIQRRMWDKLEMEFGHQPYGYDRRTLEQLRPGFLKANDTLEHVRSAYSN